MMQSTNNNNNKPMIMIPPQLENKTSIEMLQLPCDPFSNNARSPGISPPRPTTAMTASGMMRLPKVPEIVNIKSRSEGQHSPAHHHYNIRVNHDGSNQYRNLGVPQLNRTSSESSMSSLFSAPVSKHQKEEMITAPAMGVKTNDFLPMPPTLFDGNQDSLFRDIFVSAAVPQNQPAIHVSEKDASEDEEDCLFDNEFSSGCKSKRSGKRDAKTPVVGSS